MMILPILILEIVLLVLLSSWAGASFMMLELGLTIVIGIYIIRSNSLASILQNPHKMLASSRSLLAGLLLILPGIITDVWAIKLLLFQQQSNTASANTHSQQVVDGVFRRRK